MQLQLHAAVFVAASPWGGYCCCSACWPGFEDEEIEPAQLDFRCTRSSRAARGHDTVEKQLSRCGSLAVSCRGDRRPGAYSLTAVCMHEYCAQPCSRTDAALITDGAGAGEMGNAGRGERQEGGEASR